MPVKVKGDIDEDSRIVAMAAREKGKHWKILVLTIHWMVLPAVYTGWDLVVEGLGH